jgi:hypothetical protein
VAALIVIVASLRSLFKNKSDWKMVLRNTMETVAFTFCAWLILYLVAIVTTIYADHVFLVDSNAQSQAEIAELESENEKLKTNVPPASGQPKQMPRAPESTPRPEPPILTGIRIASQKRIPSDDPKLPYGLEVVIQTDADIEPVAIAVICSGAIGKGNAGFSNGGAYTMSKQGLANGHPEVYLAEWKSPVWTPRDPIVVQLFSEDAIRALSVSRMNYAWP